MQSSRPVETAGSAADDPGLTSYLHADYQFIWGTEKHSLLLLEPKLLRCVRRDHYAPYVFDYLVTSERGRTRAYATDGMRQELLAYGQNYLDPAFTNQLRSDHDHFAENFRRFLIEVNTLDCSVLTNIELDELYDTYFDYLIETYTFFALTFGWKLEATSAELQRLLAAAEGWDAERVRAAQLVLTTPAELDQVSMERTAWLQLLQRHDGEAELDDAVVLQHVRNFPWLAFNTYDDADVLDFFRLKRAQYRASGADPAVDLAALLAAKDEVIRQQAELLAQVPDERAGYLAGVLRWASQERLNLKWFWAGCEYLVRNLLNELADRIGISLHEFVHTYKRADISAFLRTGSTLSRPELKRRLHRVSYLVTGQRLFFYSGEQAERLEAELVDRALPDQDVLHGTPAYPGDVIGPVKIIKVDDLAALRQDFERFEDGDVLVTTMTQPNILMIMQRASAVLTDEGGITSHAAVLCRELGIPCVIGLHNATTQLHEGELVVVQAGHGTVRRAGPGEVATARRPPMQAAAPDRAARPEPAAESRPELLLELSQISRQDIGSVGGKAASLGELSRDFTVPAGFCVTTSAYRAFLDEGGLAGELDRILAAVEVGQPLAAELASNQVRDLVLAAPLPAPLRAQLERAYAALPRQLVAVRSSGTSEDSGATSFAGQHDSYLGIEGIEQVETAVKQCWASLHTARAIGYRQASGVDQSSSAMAVLVQELVNAESAGVIFTVHPVRLQGILIEVVQGLGEQLVSGERTPNRYTVSEQTDSIIERFETFDLPDGLIYRLAGLGRQVAATLGYPADIEFAVENDAVVLLQARPITTL